MDRIRSSEINDKKVFARRRDRRVVDAELATGPRVLLERQSSSRASALRSPATSASFFARLQGFNSRSRFNAALSDSHCSTYTSDTGKRDRVYFAPFPELCTSTRAPGSRS